MSIRPRVLLSLLTEQEEFQRMQAESARAAAVREAVELEVLWADNNPVVQIQQMYRAVSRPPGARPDVIVAQAVAVTGMEGAARSAVAAGIGWVFLSEQAPYLELLRREFPGRLAACVYVDNEEVGRLQARIVRALLPAGGSVVCVEGPAMSGASRNRRTGFEKELVGAPLRVVKSFTADWTAASAGRAISPWLHHAPEGARPSAIVAQNDDMAAGVAKAIARARPQWAGVPITGCDGLADGGLRLVREKVLAATIVIPPRGGMAIETAARHLRRQLVPFSGMVSPQVFPPLRELAAAGARAASALRAAPPPRPT